MLIQGVGGVLWCSVSSPDLCIFSFFPSQVESQGGVQTTCLKTLETSLNREESNGTNIVKRFVHSGRMPGVEGKQITSPPAAHHPKLRTYSPQLPARGCTRVDQPIPAASTWPKCLRYSPQGAHHPKLRTYSPLLPAGGCTGVDHPIPAATIGQSV